jgi:hypothetical protein
MATEDPQVKSKRLALLQKCKDLRQELTKLKQANTETTKMIEQLETSAKSLRPPVFNAPGVTKQYAEGVQASGGLTGVKPSIVKALQIIEKSATKPACDEVLKGITAQLGEAKKAAGGDAAKQQEYNAMVKHFGDVVAAINKLIEKDTHMTAAAKKFADVFEKLATEAATLEGKAAALKVD